MTARDAPPLPVLEAEDDELQGRVFALASGENRIGRAPDNDVVVPSRFVSRYHAVVVCEDDVVVVVPMTEKPIKVNDRDSKAVSLRIGDVVQLGRTRLRLKLR